uniref:Family with sequence similarity 227 member A n=1 Tax=Otolemur garnettii TaxID=30611 RepID=H0XKB5_OTOGA
MEIINVNALPIIPLDDPLTISCIARKTKGGAVRKSLEDNPPSCIIGSIHQVNQKIGEIDLTFNPMANSLAIEKFELEKKALRKKNYGSPGDRVPKSQHYCQLSEFKIARSHIIKRESAHSHSFKKLFFVSSWNARGPGVLPNGCALVRVEDGGSVPRPRRTCEHRQSFCSEKELGKFLSSPAPRAMWLDSFWWIFHERYQPNKEVQDELFDRIAQGYACLLLNTQRSHYEEALLKSLPSLLSKGLYTSFCCCFPQSWFNTHEFKFAICSTMSLWIAASICPCLQSYNNWDYSELDPERFRTEELLLQRKKMMKRKDFSFLTSKSFSHQKLHSRKFYCPMESSNINIFYEKGPSAKWRSEGSFLRHTITKGHPKPTLVLRKATQQVKRISAAREYEMFHKSSCPACKIPPLTTNLFNVYGKSPLIVYFLQNYSHLQLSGEDMLVIRREQTNKATESTLTFDNVISLTLSSMRNRRNKFNKLYQLHWNEWTYFDDYLKKVQNNFFREVKNIDQREAEMQKENQMFLPGPSALGVNEEFLEKKLKGSYQREIQVRSDKIHGNIRSMNRKEKLEREREEKQKLISPLPYPDCKFCYNLDLRNPYRISALSTSR